MRGRDVVGLGEVVREVVQLPHVLLRVVRPGGEPFHRLRREVPRDPVEFRARPPAVLVDRAGSGELEVLNRMALLRGGVIERVEEAGAVHRLLLDPVDLIGLGNAGRLQHRRRNVDAMRELRAHVRVGPQPVRPGDDHRIARPAEMARHLLAPLKRRVTGVRPRGGDMRSGVLPADRLDPAVLLIDQLELLLGIEHDAVEERHLVKRAGDRALHARAVITPDVEDQRVLEIAHLLDRVQQPADVPVGVLLIAGIDLHLAGVQLLLGVAQRVPRGEQVRPLGQLSVLRDDPELLLALERLLAVRVPALIERALVAVRPLLRHVVRRMRAAGRVVHEPRLLCILRPDRVQPLDRLVGQVIREVVRLSVLAWLDAERGVVLGDDRVVLTCGAAQESPVVVESP